MSKSLCTCCAELEKSNQIAVSLEENMRQAEQERHELEDARMKAEEARRVAEEAAYLEKEERDRKVCILHIMGHKIGVSSGDDREGRFLFQHLSMALQCYNAILLHESFEGVDDPDL